MKTSPFLLLMLSLAAAHAGPRTSANYSVMTDTADSGGTRATSANYTNDGSAGLVAAVSTVAAPSETSRSGYVGQLYDVTGLVVNAGSSNVNEGATLQLAAWQLLDDASTLSVSAAGVAWSVQSGPVSGISAGGLVTAGTVYQNTPATVQGAFGGFTGLFNLTVVNVGIDDLGTYASDGIDDAWQVGYFGQPPNALAAPNADPTGGGQNNLFKYIAGLNPMDANSRFVVGIAPVPGQPGQKKIIFSPRFVDRTYVVKFRPDLGAGTWQTLTGTNANDNGNERTVTDLNATGPAKFYHIEITKP